MELEIILYVLGIIMTYISIAEDADQKNNPWKRWQLLLVGLSWPFWAFVFFVYYVLEYMNETPND